MATTNRHSDYNWRNTKSHVRSVDTPLDIGVSTLCYYLIWHSISFRVFWQPLYVLHLLLPSLLYCSLILHINISSLYIWKCPLIVGNLHPDILDHSIDPHHTSYVRKSAAVICKFDVFCRTRQLIEYKPVDMTLSVGEVELQSALLLRSLANATTLNIG